LTKFSVTPTAFANSSPRLRFDNPGLRTNIVVAALKGLHGFANSQGHRNPFWVCGFQ